MVQAGVAIFFEWGGGSTFWKPVPVRLSRGRVVSSDLKTRWPCLHYWETVGQVIGDDKYTKVTAQSSAGAFAMTEALIPCRKHHSSNWSRHLRLRHQTQGFAFLLGFPINCGTKCGSSMHSFVYSSHFSRRRLLRQGRRGLHKGRLSLKHQEVSVQASQLQGIGASFCHVHLEDMQFSPDSGMSGDQGSACHPKACSKNADNAAIWNSAVHLGS